MSKNRAKNKKSKSSQAKQPDYNIAPHPVYVKHSEVDNVNKTARVNTSEIGVSGIRISSGYVYEEFLPELQGVRGRRVYREMSDNDGTVGALLTAVDSMLKAVNWTAMPSKADKDGYYSEYVESLLDDMDHTWDDFVSEVLTYLVFGFSAFEIVYKRRMGFNAKNENFISKYDDGLIGIKKLSARAQETIDRWDVDEKGNVNGFYQTPPFGGQNYYIPMAKALLFRTTTKKNNPEGRSILRNAYKPYYMKKNIEIIEAIAIERELAGLPVISIPGEILSNSDHSAVLSAYQKMARDLKFNEQGACIIPSDPWRDEMGKPISMPKVKIELMSASGTRSIDTGLVVNRYDQNIARTVLADFLMLGNTSAGSFALSKSKTDLFLRSMEGFMKNIASVINKKLLVNLWSLNGFPGEMMPVLTPGRVAPVDLVELGDYVSKLAGAGLVFGGDKPTEKILRGVADLPEDVDVDNLEFAPHMDPMVLNTLGQDDEKPKDKKKEV